tara:strand:+ start:747 stop:1559 length:813 start_codon:yes stop_codon:yes gene_type:complete
MHDYKVALIINVRNGEKYLQECLDCLCNQTYNFFKIQIFDNFSSDNTLNISNHFYKKYPELIDIYKLPDYMPINKARNYALNFLKKNDNKFSHFSFCDSDDKWDVGWLINASKHFDNKSIIFTDGYELFGNSIKAIKVNYLKPEHSLFSSRIYLQGTIIPFFYVKNNYFFDEKVNYCIDVDKWNEFFYADIPFIHIKKNLFFYRIHGNSLSSSGFKQVMKERWILTRKYKKSKILFLLKFIFYSIKHFFLNYSKFLLNKNFIKIPSKFIR